MSRITQNSIEGAGHPMLNLSGRRLSTSSEDEAKPHNMPQFLRFLRNSKEIQGNFEGAVHVVLGNESCDMDSAVAAVTYAFLLQELNPEKKCLPILNIMRKDYSLRSDIRCLFKKHSIGPHLLTFRDEIDLFRLMKKKKLQLTLVDHNVLVQSDAVFSSSVVEIIDHRPQEEAPRPGLQLYNEAVGSCCTLITEKFLTIAKPVMLKEVSCLLHATILMDTINLSTAAGKMTPKDAAVMQKLEVIMGGNVNRNAIFKELLAAKFDTSKLSTLEILKKDLKVVTAKSSKMAVAMSSIPGEVKDFLGRENFSSEISWFCRELKTAAVVILSLDNDDTGIAVKRALAVYSEDQNLAGKITAALEDYSQPSLELTPFPVSLANVRAYDQGNLKPSRKQILPVVKAVLEAI